MSVLATTFVPNSKGDEGRSHCSPLVSSPLGWGSEGQADVFSDAMLAPLLFSLSHGERGRTTSPRKPQMGETTERRTPDESG